MPCDTQLRLCQNSCCTKIRFAAYTTPSPNAWPRTCALSGSQHICLFTLWRFFPLVVGTNGVFGSKYENLQNIISLWVDTHGCFSVRRLCSAERAWSWRWLAVKRDNPEPQAASEGFHDFCALQDLHLPDSARNQGLCCCLSICETFFTAASRVSAFVLPYHSRWKKQLNLSNDILVGICDTRFL